MTKPTRSSTITALLILGLAACSGGGGGGGGGGIPTATNAAIAPPPTTPVPITATGGGAATSQANQSIGANGFSVSSGAKGDAMSASGLVASAQSPNGGTQATRETLGTVVRRHAEKLKDHQWEQSSATSMLQVETQPCAGGGTLTFAFDDASLSATEVFVNCNEGGTVLHGTIRSSNVGVGQNLGSTVGSAYTISVTATFTIDLAVTTTSPASFNVTQGSFTFTAAFSGTMVASGNGGVQPGAPNHVVISMNGASLLSSDGTVRELLSNFTIIVDDDDTMGRTTISGGYTYASTAINGSVTVTVTTPIVYQPQTASHPSLGAVTITSSGSPGQIVVTVISLPAPGVRVDVSDGVNTNTASLTWTEVDAL